MQKNPQWWNSKGAWIFAHGKFFWALKMRTGCGRTGRASWAQSWLILSQNGLIWIFILDRAFCESEIESKIFTRTDTESESRELWHYCVVNGRFQLVDLCLCWAALSFSLLNINAEHFQFDCNPRDENCFVFCINLRFRSRISGGREQNPAGSRQKRVQQQRRQRIQLWVSSFCEDQGRRLEFLKTCTIKRW